MSISKKNIMSISKKAKFRDHLKDFYRDHFQTDEGTLNTMQLSRGLSLFYITNVFNVLNPGVFPEDIDEIEDLIVDASGDQGCDIIHKSDDHVYIIQVKYKKKKSIEDVNEVHRFKNILERFHPTAKEKKNKNLTNAIYTIDFKNDQFSLLYITLGQKNNDIEILEKKKIEIPDIRDFQDIDYRTEFRVLDESELNIELRESFKEVDKDKEIILEVNKSDSHGTPWYQYNANDQVISYVASINAASLRQIYTKERRSLFNLNIRNYIGETRTNKGIIESAKESPGLFYFYNNGISAVAEKITADQENAKLKCKNFSIINGAQSVRSIVKAFDDTVQESNAIKDLDVLIRITEVPFLSDPKYGGTFLDKITTFNNTQNVVKAFDFRSNDDVQIFLSNFFKKIAYKGRHYYYKNKRIRDSKSNKITINLDEFTKILHAFVIGPHDCYGGMSNLYSLDQNGGYFKLYGDSETKELNSTLSNETLKYYSSIFFLYEYAKKSFKNLKSELIEKEENDDTLDGNTKLATASISLFIFTLRKVLEFIAEKEQKSIKDFMINSVYVRPEWKDKKKQIDFVDEVVSLTIQILCNNFTFSSTAKNFNPRNWLRDKETLKSLNTTLSSNNHSLKMLYNSYKNN